MFLHGFWAVDRFVLCCRRLIETHRGENPTVEGGTELRPEWRAWVDRSLRYHTKPNKDFWSTSVDVGAAAVCCQCASACDRDSQVDVV